MGLGENLLRLHDAKVWTQAEAADAATVPFSRYQDLGSGTREPGLEAVVKLAAAFGVSGDELLVGIAPKRKRRK